MMIIPVPRWKREIHFFWRTNTARGTRVRQRRVLLPRKVWIERNFGGLKKYAVGERNREDDDGEGEGREWKDNLKVKGKVDLRRLMGKYGRWEMGRWKELWIERG